MRRILGACWRSTANRAVEFGRGWDQFWFRPADTALLGLLRILTGSMLVYTHAVWGLALADFFGPDGWMQAETVHAMHRERNPYAWSFWWLVPPEAMWWVHGAALVVLVLFTLGVLTRATSVLSFIITVSYIYRAPLALFGLDQINTLLTLYLTVGYLGTPARDRVLALDRRLAEWWKRRRLSRRRMGSDGAGERSWEPRPSVSANVGIRLIQVHMCVIYFFAGISKLQGPAWWSGDAMWLAFANLEYQSYDMTWLAHYPLLVNVMTHATLVWEISFAALVWLRWWRPLVLFGAVVLHVGIGACLGMWTFGLIMLVGCASFLPPEMARALARSFARAAVKQRSWVEPGKLIDVAGGTAESLSGAAGLGPSSGAAPAKAPAPGRS